MPQSTATKKAAPTKAATTKRAAAKPRPATATKTNGSTRPEPARPAVTNNSGQPRLGKGELETLVLDHMKKNPKVEFTSTELSNKLHRSNGAISNALEKHAAKGTVVRTNDSPRRYRWAGAKPARKASGTKKAR
jgi:hypothetical protein